MRGERNSSDGIHDAFRGFAWGRRIDDVTTLHASQHPRLPAPTPLSTPSPPPPQVPLLPGAKECVSRGIFSSLQPANLRLKRAVSNEAEALSDPTYPLLYDPQARRMQPALIRIVVHSSYINSSHRYSFCLHSALTCPPALPIIIQTAGGLLASIPAGAAERCIAELHALGYPHAAVVGQVTSILPGEDVCAATQIHCLP